MDMPDHVATRHHELNVSAREMYGLRNMAEDIALADEYHDAGDRCFRDALAITEEWDAS